MSRVSGPGPAGSAKEKRSFSKRLFRGRAAGGGAGSAPTAAPAPAPSGRSLGGFMSRVLKTLSTLSHYSSEPETRGALAPRLPPPQATGGLGSCFPPGPPRSPEPPPRPAGGSEAVPGVAGLRNHGNTCFMNAILQCLSNTELFAEFLALEQFRGGPPPADGPPPAPGEVTEQLAQLVRALWTLEYTPQHSRDFKVSRGLVPSRREERAPGRREQPRRAGARGAEAAGLGAQPVLPWLTGGPNVTRPVTIAPDRRLPRSPAVVGILPVRAATPWEEPCGPAGCVPVAPGCCSCCQHPPRAAHPAPVTALGTHGSALGMGQVLPPCSLLMVFEAG